MWCPTALEVNGVISKHPLPEPSMPLNFINSTGLRYEAQEVRQCLLQGEALWNLIWREAIIRLQKHYFLCDGTILFSCVKGPGHSKEKCQSLIKIHLHLVLS